MALDESQLEGPLLDDADAPEEEQDDSVFSPDDPLEDKEELQKALLSLYAKCKAEDRYPRLVEVKDVKQAEFYWGGRQYIWWSTQDQRWNIPTQPMASFDDQDVDDMPRFEFVTNIYQARGLMMIGAVAGAPPRIRFFPDDADNQDDLDTAEGRTKLAKLIERWNPPQISLQEETYHAWTGGFIAWWPHYVENGEKYGFDSSPTLEQGQQELESTISCPNCGWSAPAAEAVPPVPCPECSQQLTAENISEEEPIAVPEEGEESQIPKGRLVIPVYGALNCCRPQHVNHQSQFHYFGIEDEVHYSTLRAAFEDVADEIKPGLNSGADDVFERNARLSVSENTRLVTQTGANQANLCTFVVCWFRPSAFWMLDDKKQREELLGMFPRGVRVEFTGRVYCRSKAESMDDAIKTCHAMPGRGQHRAAVGTATISVQDRINTLSNIEMETYEYGIPITYRASDTWDSNANESQRAAPGLEVEVALRPGENIQQRIFQVRADSVSPDMAKHADDLIGPISDLITGTYPAVSGAGSGQGAPDTLGQQVMQRDTAMGRLGIFYVNLKQAHADVMTLACKIVEDNTSGELKVPSLGASGDFENETIDVSALEGEADAYPEGDENFPMLWNEQRASMMQMMETPQGAALAGDPDNAELFTRLAGIPGLKIPGRDSWQKQLREISELTKMPQGDGMLAGIAPQVEVDSDDNHQVESEACKWWMNSQRGQKMKQQNPMGWLAVKDHKKQHDQAIPAPPPPTKPLSETFTTNFKDLPPEAQVQALAQVGIHIDQKAFVDQVLLEQAKNHKSAPAKTLPGAPPTGEPQKALPPAGTGNLQ
jgi:hypothetical protein